MTPRARTILWLDASAALLAGTLVLLLRGWLTELHDFSPRLILVLGLVNLGYGLGSGTLAVLASTGRPPRRRWIDLLIAGNLGWTVVCAALIAVTAATASGFGLAHLGFEGAFVAGLALLERRYVRPVAPA